jgi:predicted phage terminase large subunit-like protein
LKTTLFDFSRRRDSLQTSSQNSPDFLEFYRRTIPGTWSADAPHLPLIAECLHDIHSGVMDRWAVHMPPRHAKTETITVRGAAWLFILHPADNILITAATDRLARRFSRKIRQIVCEWLGVKLTKAADDEWTLPQGGSCVARGVGSPPVGIGFKYIFIDDPIRSRETAESVTYREKAWDWYTDDIYTRLEPGGAMILNGTRWHHEDVFAKAVATEPDAFTITVLRAIAEEGDADALGRKPGESLWPQRFSPTDLERIRQVLTREEGEYSWQALYQQRPTPQEGDIFKPGALVFVDSAPPGIGLMGCRAWDLAATQNGGDWTAGAHIAVDKEGIVWIMDMVRFRQDSSHRDRTIRETADRDGNGVTVRLPQDPGQAGKSQVPHFLKLLHGYRVKMQTVTGSKATRAGAFSSQVNGGNVRVVRGSWNSAMVEEMRRFTGSGGETDDQIDALADAYNELAKPRTQWAVF